MRPIRIRLRRKAMDKRLLQWTAIEIGRRKFLYSATAAIFGLLAGLAGGRIEVLASCPCSGPYGSGQCLYQNCNPSTCSNSGGINCNFTSDFCGGGTACWSCPGYGCCDCLCRDSYGDYWYCWCSYSIP